MEELRVEDFSFNIKVETPKTSFLDQ